MVKIINHLMSVRVARGISQRHLAQIMAGNTVQSSICNWETGRNTPEMDGLRRWADALGFDVHIALRERGPQ